MKKLTRLSMLGAMILATGLVIGCASAYMVKTNRLEKEVEAKAPAPSLRKGQGLGMVNWPIASYGICDMSWLITGIAWLMGMA